MINQLDFNVLCKNYSTKQLRGFQNFRYGEKIGKKISKM